MINKTNQFNLTTIRRTQEEVEALGTCKDALVLAMDVRDKYGDYGLVGVSILKKQNRTCIIDTLLMSCRVLGRGVEDTFLAKLGEAARKLGLDQRSGRYMPTAKNPMFKDLYHRFNFKYEPDTDAWVVNLSEAPASPQYVHAALRLA